MLRLKEAIILEGVSVNDLVLKTDNMFIGISDKSEIKFYFFERISEIRNFHFSFHGSQ